MGPRRTGAHDDKSGSAQVVGEPLGREAGGEIPAAAAGAFHARQNAARRRVPRQFPPALRRRGQLWMAQVGTRQAWRTLGWTTERNKNYHHPWRRREAACRTAGDRGQEASGGWVGRRDFLYALRISDGGAKVMARAGTATQIIPLRDNRKYLAWNFTEFVVGRLVA
jgi:hypothetical protein